MPQISPTSLPTLSSLNTQHPTSSSSGWARMPRIDSLPSRPVAHWITLYVMAVSSLMAPDWHEWHRAYDAPDSPLSQRLAVVQQYIRMVLDNAPPGPVRVVSMCAGEGRDLLGVLAEHP